MEEAACERSHGGRMPYAAHRSMRAAMCRGWTMFYSDTASAGGPLLQFWARPLLSPSGDVEPCPRGVLLDGKLAHVSQRASRRLSVGGFNCVLASAYVRVHV